jgi:hypothetical protein
MFKQIWKWIEVGYLWLCKLNYDTAEGGPQWDAVNEAFLKKNKKK